MDGRRHASSDVFGLTLFSLMVAAVATGALVVVGGFGLIAACSLGVGAGVVVAIVLSVLPRSREPRPARSPGGRAGVGIGASGADASPRGVRSDPASASQSSDSGVPRRTAGPAR